MTNEAEPSFEQLFALAEAGPILDKLERALRQKGDHAAADALVKLQQDAGVAVDRVFYGGYAHPGDGTAAGELSAAYEPVTQERLAVLVASASLLHAGDRARLARLGLPMESRLGQSTHTPGGKA